MVGEGVGLLRVDEVGELERIADEEDGRVVAGQVVVAVLRVELHGEATRVADGLGRPFAAGHGREPGEGLGTPAHRRQKACPGEGGDVGRHFERAVGARAAGVDDALGDALAVEAGQLLDEVLVLEQHRPAGAGRLGPLVVGHGGPGLGGEDLLGCHARHPALLLSISQRV